MAENHLEWGGNHFDKRAYARAGACLLGVYLRFYFACLIAFSFILIINMFVIVLLVIWCVFYQ